METTANKVSPLFRVRDFSFSYPEEEAKALGKRQIPGSVSFVPGAAGLILAGEVIKDLAGK